MDSLQISTLNFVASRRMLLAPQMVPENVVLGDYGMMPYVRTGLAAAITGDPPAGEVRATVNAQFTVAASDGSTRKNVGRALQLYGPADVIGIDPGQVIRREPSPGADRIEHTYMAHVEFDRPDFPWLFSPFKVTGNTLIPWLALVVCEAGLSQIEPSIGEYPARLHTVMGELQPLQTNHYFAHAQVSGVEVDANGIVVNPADAQKAITTRLSDEHGLLNLSRIVCPRRLTEGTQYIAALVPALDCGLKAAMSQSGGTLGRAWERAPGDEENAIVLPVYDHWTFRTAKGGDFEELAAKLVPVRAPWTVGRKFIDMSQPGGGLKPVAGAKDILECALVSPSPPEFEEVAWPDTSRKELLDKVTFANASDTDLPRVGPRLYARYQAAAVRLSGALSDGEFDAPKADANWFTQLNTTPAHRIVAGLGTRVIRKDQESIMQAAWAQVEGIRRANRAIILAQFAEVMNKSVMRRHISRLPIGALTQVTRTVHARIKLAAAPRTFSAAILLSRVADASTTLAFRRATAPMGALSRKAGAALPGLKTLRDQRLTYANPDGITKASALGLAALPDRAFAAVFGGPVPDARAQMAQRYEMLAQTGTAFRVLADAPAWTPKAGISVSEALGGVVLRQLDTLMVKGQPGLEAKAAIFAAMTAAGNERLRGNAAVMLDRVVPALPLQTLRFRNTVALPSLPAGPLRRLGPIGNLPIRGVGPIRELGPIVRPMPDVVIAPPSRPPVQPVPDKPADRFASPASKRLSDSLTRLDAMPVAQVVASMRDVMGQITGGAAIGAALQPLRATQPQILAQIDPAQRGAQRFKGRLRDGQTLIPPGLIDRFGLTPIMKAPIFNRPMYEALHQYDPEWLVPGLAAMKQRDLVTLLVVNDAFCEAFLIGLSDELGRELLWRDYPTDQRGTYFRRFWDDQADELTEQIHRFGAVPLGGHFSVGGPSAPSANDEGKLVMVVRGEIVSRFPDLIPLAVKRLGTAEPPVFEKNEAEILFRARLGHDVLLVGFDLTETQVRDHSYWFLLAQNPTAPSFGIDAEDGTAPGTGATVQQNDLDWDDVAALRRPAPDTQRRRFIDPDLRTLRIESTSGKPPVVDWPGHAGIVARTLMRNPQRAAFEGKPLIDVR